MPTLSFFLNNVLEILANAITEENTTGTNITWEKIKFSSADDTIFYLRNKFSKITRYKKNIQKLIAFL